MPDENEPERKTSINILCKFVFKQKTGFLVGKQKLPVQGILLSYGFEITNIDSQPFKGGTVSNILISSYSSSLSVSSHKKLTIPNLNPGVSTTIWVDVCTMHFEGASWLSCYLIPDDPNIVISPYQQEDDGSYQPVVAKKENVWGDVIYVMPKMELLQARTNYLVALLTVMTVIDSMFGIKAIGMFLLNLLVIVLQFFVNVIQNIIK